MAALRRASTRSPKLPKPIGAPPDPVKFKDGTLVKLHGLKGGVTLGLEKFDGRMGRVVRMADPLWSRETGLVAVILDSRTGDFFRAAGCWVGVPPQNLKLL